MSRAVRIAKIKLRSWWKLWNETRRVIRFARFFVELRKLHDAEYDLYIEKSRKNPNHPDALRQEGRWMALNDVISLAKKRYL